MEKYTNKTTLLKALKLEDPRAFKEFYKLHYGKVAAYVRNNNGSEDEVQDLFQEAVIVLLRYLRKPDFKLNENTQIGTFFFGIAKRMWLLKLRNSKVKSVELTNKEQFQEDEITEKMIFEEKHELIAKHFEDLGEDCQKILTDYYFNKVQLKTIGEQLGYTAAFVRVKKNRCMNCLKKMVQNDKVYKEILEKQI